MKETPQNSDGPLWSQHLFCCIRWLLGKRSVFISLIATVFHSMMAGQGYHSGSVVQNNKTALNSQLAVESELGLGEQIQQLTPVIQDVQG